MKLDIYEQLSSRSLVVGGIRISIVHSRGGAYCHFRKDVERFVVSLSHPDYYGKDDSKPTFTAISAEGPTRREAMAKAIADARSVWTKGKTLWGS